MTNSAMGQATLAPHFNPTRNESFRLRLSVTGRVDCALPTAERSASRLLCLSAQDGGIAHREFVDLPGLLRAGDLLVFNNTRVIPARLTGHKETGGKVEVLLERITGPMSALCQVRASKSPKPGSAIIIDGEADCRAEVTGREGEFFQLQFNTDNLPELARAHWPYAFASLYRARR